MWNWNQTETRKMGKILENRKPDKRRESRKGGTEKLVKGNDNKMAGGGGINHEVLTF